LGASAKDIKAVMGHASIQVTNRYTLASDPDKLRAVDAGAARAGAGERAAEMLTIEAGG